METINIFILWRGVFVEEMQNGGGKNYKGCKSEAVNFLLTLVSSSKKDVSLASDLVQQCDRKCCGLVFKWMF